jgi:hypothetical protein
VGQRELWQWLTGLALVVLLLEWQMFHRRQFPVRITGWIGNPAGRVEK